MRWIEKRSADLAAVALVLMMLLISVNVALRFLWNTPINGVTEITSMYLMVALSWLAIANTQRLKRHISADVLFRSLSDRWKRVVECGIYILCALAALLIAWLGLQQGLQGWGRATTGAVSIPTAPPRLIFAVGMGLLAIRFALDALGIIQGKDSNGQDRPTESHAGSSSGDDAL